MNGESGKNQAHIGALWERLLIAANADHWPETYRLFNEARVFAKSNEMAFFELHVLYARYLIERREYDKSLPHLRFLRGLYVQVGVTDYSFLGIRGIPPFETYLSLAKDYLAARPENMAELDLLEGLLDALDAEGKASTRATIESLRADGSAC